MLINVQRVSSSSVEVNGSMVAQIKKGLLCLICAVPNDTVNTCERVVEKLSKLRIFNDLNGKMNKSLIDINGSVLMVSQFTLAANTKVEIVLISEEQWNLNKQNYYLII